VIADWRSLGHGPLTSILKEDESTKPVDPVVIDRGSGQSAFTALPASSAASTSSGLGESIVGEGVVVREGPVGHL